MARHNNLVGCGCCGYCNNARIDDALTDDNDFSSRCVIFHDKNRVMVHRAGVNR